MLARLNLSFSLGIVLKGAPRLGAARRHPPAPRLKRGDTPSRRRRLGAQGARLQQGARRSPESPPTARPGTPSFSFFFFFFFFFFLLQSGLQRPQQPQIHSKRRNRLNHQRLNDLVYIKYNRALKRRYNERNTIDPISLKDIDDSNEWLIGRMEDEDSHGGAQDDFVFDDDNLTWGDVARAAGAEEARFDTRARARASSSIITPTRGIASSSRTLPSYSLIDEDEDGDMVDSADEEDGEGYKCGDGNDDDDDFVD
ncbi:hypothetical protein CK203_015534 [Vitis vinifera]|uniref:Uncharacterized protein n=1 Tax=Vitis vinifera TaxID=29760 RepID=A0A438J5J5_VITVI|nr:hypothetical protein CK203_015534 [Vitis vinifera]